MAAVGPEIWSSPDGLSWQRTGEVPIGVAALDLDAEGSRVDLAWDGARLAMVRQWRHPAGDPGSIPARAGGNEPRGDVHRPRPCPIRTRP